MNKRVTPQLVSHGIRQNDDARPEIVVTAHHNPDESDVVRSGAIGNQSGASIEDLVCFYSTD